MPRLFDIVAAGMALALLAPVLLGFVVVLRFTGEGEVLFRQTRIGQGGKPFKMLKFVTMLKDSGTLGGNLTYKGDPRVLQIGSCLRKTKLNELPQLLNVLKGDMALIGPRPQTPDHFYIYPAEVQQALNSIRPGLSGVASLVYRDEEALMQATEGESEEVYARKIAPYKGRLEYWYAQQRSVRLDLKIMALTLVVIMSPGSTLYQRWLHGLPAAKEQLE